MKQLKFRNGKYMVIDLTLDKVDRFNTKELAEAFMRGEKPAAEVFTFSEPEFLDDNAFSE